MNAKGRFISTLLVINAFFGGYAFGFNNRHVLIVDPSLPPLVVKQVETKKEEVKESTTKKSPEPAKTAAEADKAKKHEKQSKNKHGAETEQKSGKKEGKDSSDKKASKPKDSKETTHKPNKEAAKKPKSQIAKPDKSDKEK